MQKQIISGIRSTERKRKLVEKIKERGKQKHKRHPRLIKQIYGVENYTSRVKLIKENDVNENAENKNNENRHDGNKNDDNENDDQNKNDKNKNDEN